MHEIRLRKPWLRFRHDRSDGETVDVPDQDEPDPADQGPVRYCRRFNLPSGLQGGSRVYLRIDRWEGRLEEVMVNDRVVDLDDSVEFKAELTPLLQPHNQVTVQLAPLPGQPARLSGQVTLVIEEI